MAAGEFRFRNRAEAGHELASRLMGYQSRKPIGPSGRSNPFRQPMSEVATARPNWR